MERRRDSDLTLERIEQQLLDLKELMLLKCDTCGNAVNERLDAQAKEIGDLRKFIRKIEIPVQFIGWSVIAVVAGILALFGHKWGHWLWQAFGGSPD